MNSLPSPNAADDPGPHRRRAADAHAATLGERPSSASMAGIFVGRWRSARLLLGWSWPALVLIVLGGAWWFAARPGDSDLPVLGLLLLLAAGMGSVIQTLLRIEFGDRLGRPLRQVSLTAIGYRIDGDRVAVAGHGAERILTAAGPTSVIIAAAIALAAAISLSPSATSLWVAWESPRLEGHFGLHSAVRVAAWVWLTQGLLMALPIPGSIGREVLLGMVEQGGPRASHTAVRRRVDRIQGAVAILLAAAALWQWSREPVETAMPVWPFLVALSLLVWSGRGGGSTEETPQPQPSRQPRLSWWSRLRIRRAQRVEREEAIDASRMDEVLEKLHREGAASLTGAERSLLRRVSQRLRQDREL